MHNARYYYIDAPQCQQLKEQLQKAGATVLSQDHLWVSVEWPDYFHSVSFECERYGMKVPIVHFADGETWIDETEEGWEDTPTNYQTARSSDTPR